MAGHRNPTIVRQLLRYAAQVALSNRAYPNSRLYTTDSVRALELTKTEVIIQTADKAGRLSGSGGLLSRRVARSEQCPTLSRIANQKHWLFTPGSQNRSRLPQGEPDGPTNDRVSFYTNIRSMTTTSTRWSWPLTEFDTSNSES